MDTKKRLINRFLRRVHERQTPDINEVEKMGLVRFWWASRHLRRKQREARKTIRAFQKNWARMTPHEQLSTFISILDRHPHVRKAMREALGIETRQIQRPGPRPARETPAGIVLP